MSKLYAVDAYNHIITRNHWFIISCPKALNVKLQTHFISCCLISCTVLREVFQNIENLTNNILCNRTVTNLFVLKFNGWILDILKYFQVFCMYVCVWVNDSRGYTAVHHMPSSPCRHKQHNLCSKIPINTLIWLAAKSSSNSVFDNFDQFYTHFNANLGV